MTDEYRGFTKILKSYIIYGTYFNNTSKSRSERFSFSARRDKEAVVFPTATRSNEAMEENRQNPSGCGQSAPDTASGGRASAPDGTMKHRPQTPSYH
ncbi:MAG TPA: hypothetical protein VJK01_00220 [Candidatus Paceibacterota bacterium]